MQIKKILHYSKAKKIKYHLDDSFSYASATSSIDANGFTPRTDQQTQKNNQPINQKEPQKNILKKKKKKIFLTHRHSGTEDTNWGRRRAGRRGRRRTTPPARRSALFRDLSTPLIFFFLKEIEKKI